MKRWFTIFLFLLASCSDAVTPGNPLIDPTLIGGAAADPKDWPASEYCSMGNSRCSCTMIGDRTLLIASHCVSNGGTASFSAGPNRYSAKCTHNPKYSQAAYEEMVKLIASGATQAQVRAFAGFRNATADWTLCLTNAPVTGFPFENIMTDPAKIKIGDTVRLTGYGCVKPGGGGGNDGVFRTGTAKVTDLPSGSDYDTVTKGGAALCYGDSGGAAYVELPGGDREIFGVNSRGDIATTSYLSSTFVSEFKTWAQSWATKNGQKICGLDPSATGCRTVSPPAPSPGPYTFAIDTKVAKGTATLTMKSGFETLFDRAKQAVLDTLNAF